MREVDFRGVFGCTPAGFKKNVGETLNHLEEDKDMKIHAVSVRILMIAALVALLAGTALALTRNASVLDMREGALPEAQEAVMELSEIASFESPLVRYQPTEILIDQNRLLIAVQATPVDPEKYMIEYEWIGMEAIERAEREGKTLIGTDVGVTLNEKTSNTSTRTTYEDNVLTIRHEYELLEDIADHELEITLTGYDKEVLDPGVQHWDEAERYLDRPEVIGETNVAVKSFTVKPNYLSVDTLRIEGPYELEYITIDWVEMNRTAASLMMKLQYTLHEDLTDEIKEDLWSMSIRMNDPAGMKDVRTFEYDSISMVSYQVGSSRTWEYDESSIVEGTYIEESIWPAISEWPEKFELVAYYKEMGEWSKTVELRLEDAK